MRTIRNFLLTEYIGAILAGVLVADAFGTLIGFVVGQVSYYVQSRHNPILSSHRPPTSYFLLESVVKAALYLLVAYLVVRWLYPAESHPSGSDDGTAAGERDR